MARKDKREIEIDEIFLDQKNSPGFRKENLEGMIENPVKKEMFWFLAAVIAATFLFFGSRAYFLQIVNGEAFLARAEKNFLRAVSQRVERGIIYDRDMRPLAYNETAVSGGVRKYPPRGFLHVLGFLSYSGKEQGELAYGASGLESSYDEVLRGEPAKGIEEVDAKGNVIGEGILEKGKPGENILTSISYDLQQKLAEALDETMRSRGFRGGAGVIMDARSGEILALVSAPEFDPNLLAGRNKPEEVNRILGDAGKPFLNRAVSGLYAPGSIVKPALAAGALFENIITPEEKILSTGSISLPNPYDPSRPNIFLDWKAHGWVDMRQALAQSSDVYFYEIGGGYQGRKGLGPWNIKKYLSMFGMDSKSGIDLPGEASGHLPDPLEKQGGRDWTVGDTYHISIGQGNISITPIEAAVYASAIAGEGAIVYPHLVTAVLDQNKKPVQVFSYPQKEKLALPPEIFRVIQDGMRASALRGTAAGLGGIPLEIAAKTGTAELGQKDRVNSWSIGFLPAGAPRLAFAILLESGPRQNTIGATYVASEVFRWAADTGFLDTIDKQLFWEYNGGRE
ncbi:MAG: hypothetical protein HYW15_02550 [Candidatus Giovannonibacteria bacterium]|nr:MAG: hypothetical protein HYW15_02550 [Candidatus Giovannonibacteria bacterium]